MPGYCHRHRLQTVIPIFSFVHREVSVIIIGGQSPFIIWWCPNICLVMTIEVTSWWQMSSLIPLKTGGIYCILGGLNVVVHEKLTYHTFSERSERALSVFLIHYLAYPFQSMTRSIYSGWMCWCIPCQFRTSPIRLYVPSSPIQCALDLWLRSVSPVILLIDPSGYNVHIYDPETGSVYWSGRWACREQVSSGWSLM